MRWVGQRNWVGKGWRRLVMDGVREIGWCWEGLFETEF